MRGSLFRMARSRGPRRLSPAVLFVILLSAFAGPSMCFGDRWHASTGVPGGRGALSVDVVTYHQQLYGGRCRNRREDEPQWDTYPKPADKLVFYLEIRSVGPKHVMLFSAAGKPLSVDMTVQPWRVVETDDEKTATIWDQDEGAKRSGQGLSHVEITQWSIRHQRKTYFLSVATTPDHILRTSDSFVHELYPLTLDADPPKEVCIQYHRSGPSSPER